MLTCNARMFPRSVVPHACGLHACVTTSHLVLAYLSFELRCSGVDLDENHVDVLLTAL